MSDVPSRTPAIVGFLLAGALLLAIGFFVSSRTQKSSPPPELRILQPRTGDTVAHPVALSFATPAALRLTRAGWTADELHIHLLLDGNEVMPAAADISASDTSFSWRLPPLQPGSHQVYLTWAARHHGNIESPADTAVFVVRP